MATTTIRYTPIKGRVLRVVAEDVCGVPLCGVDPDAAVIITSGFTQVAQAAQYDTGEEHIVRTADADLCVNEKDPDAFKRMELTIDMCTVDPGLIARTVSPSRLLTDLGNVGTGFALAEGISDRHFSLEVWQRVAGAGACDPSGNQLWVYNAWPHLRFGKIGDYAIAAAPSTLQVIAESAPVSPLWWIGDDWLDDAVSPVPDHWFQNVTTVPPPAPVPGIQDLACPDSS